MSRHIVRWSAILIGALVTASAFAFPIPLVKSSARSTSATANSIVGNGIYPATASRCYSQPTQRSMIPFTNGGQTQTAPSVIAVYWPGAQPTDPAVHALFPDFVKDLFDGPYWNAVMPQYTGAAHGVFQASIDLPAFLTLQPSNTVRIRTITGELLAQQAAGVLPAPDPLGNTTYVLHFPPGVTLIDSTYEYVDYGGRTALHINIGTSCVQYCAYHDFHLDPNTLKIFTFVVMPDYRQNAGCQGGCGSGSPFDIYTEVLSHELFETVSDPFATGWLNNCAGGEEEIADVCAAYYFHVPRRVATPGTPACPSRWALASVFSNAAFNSTTGDGCVVADATTQDCVLGVVPQPGLAATLDLSAPSPNPAVAGTRLRYSLPFASFVRLSVTDVAGRKVAVLDRQLEGPGTHSAAWDGQDAGGQRVPAGLYFVRLEAAGRTLSRKVAIDR